MTLLQRAADYLKSAVTFDIDQALADFKTHERGLPMKCEKLHKQRRKIMAARRTLLRLSDEVSKLGDTDPITDRHGKWRKGLGQTIRSVR